MMIAFVRADHIHICVPAAQLEEARQFYMEVLGLREIERPNHLFSSIGHWFDIGDIQLHIGVEDTMIKTIRHTAFEVNDIEAARKQLEKYNVEILWEPEIPGRIRFAFLDPFGNRMELLQLVN